MKRRGYTLYEMMLVMAIVLIIAALTSPLIFEGLRSEGDVNAASDLVRSRWADCRSQAIEEGRAYRFAVIPNTGKFKIEPFDPARHMNGPAFANQGGTTTIGPDGQPTGPNGPAVQGVMPFITNQASPVENEDSYVIEDALPSGVRFGTKDTPVDPGSEEAKDGDYVTVAVFLPDGTAMQDVEITFGTAAKASAVTLRLRGMTGAVTTVQGEDANK
jgi:prepilin-type N-terminal cleavage/methylation domain-containing protein